MAENYPAEEARMPGVGEVMQLSREHRMGLHVDPHPGCSSCGIERLIGKAAEQPITGEDQA